MSASLWAKHLSFTYSFSSSLLLLLLFLFPPPSPPPLPPPPPFFFSSLLPLLLLLPPPPSPPPSSSFSSSLLLFLLPIQVIPMLEQGLDSPENQERQGVCIGLSEIIQQTSRDNVLLYVDSLLPTIRNALCDKEPDVRAAAAQTFDSLHSTVGKYVNEFSLFNSVYS